ncbi:hypothetical protein Hbl1158_16945 (plasmid) [Halobaculum sp. CBA1158]|uniref:hypothetical protein n=1 Tax=Halobaculum sp. CBA1158 TaxID=2904243 RepID=UPI001F3C703A|nr:hypothetical protein [Halobaculum sp. CBA1158]UIP01742.1 hypothetical protein Hbl1158_16945 [Halobaculum sp. CBA1158]
MVLRNKGPSQPDPDEQQRRQEETQAGLTGLQLPEEEENQTELIQELSESDLREEVDDQAFRNLLTKDIPTSNFDEEQISEFRAYGDVALMKKKARYPHPGQDVTGVLREWAHDDPNAGLRPQDRGDLAQYETLTQSYKARVMKGKDGALVRSVLSSIRHSIVDRAGGSDSGGRLLSRIRS